MRIFIKEVISSIKNIGAIAPSSRFLTKNILKDIVFKENQVILEFGPGNGAITKQILKRMPKSSTLISLEINEQFFEHCKSKFLTYNNFKIFSHSAVEFDTVLDKLSINKVDHLVSSLPLAILPKQDLNDLFEKIPNHIKDNGSFVQYQYSLNKYRFLKRFFETVELDFTLVNIPPAFVYKCYSSN